MKHRAVVIGAGRIGAGFGWPDYPFIYTHADAYLKLRERVQLVGFVEPDKERAEQAYRKYELPIQKSLAGFKDIDMVSICVPPAHQMDVFKSLPKSVKGVWCEKPYRGPNHPVQKVQVNYIRRFDLAHQMVRVVTFGMVKTLYVWAKHDEHTLCHFLDLMKFWEVEADRFVYHDNSKEIPATNTYRLDCGKLSFEFRNGGVSGGFMEKALLNLLDAMEDKADLISPACKE